MEGSPAVEWVRAKYLSLAPVLDELARRRWAAVEAISLGWGGVAAVAEATGMSRTTIAKGIREGRGAVEPPVGRIRRPGGGRKPATHGDPGLAAALENLLEPSTRGHPESPLRWTCKSTRRLSA